MALPSERVPGVDAIVALLIAFSALVLLLTRGRAADSSAKRAGAASAGAAAAAAAAASSSEEIGAVRSYWLADQSLPWHTLGFGFVAATFGSAEIAGLVRGGQLDGIAASGESWLISGALLVLATWVAPVYLRARVHSLPEYCGRRFMSRGVRTYVAFASVFFQLFGRLVASVVAGQVLLLTVQDVDSRITASLVLVLYGLGASAVAATGMTGVSRAQALQGVVVVLGGLAMMGQAFTAIGGWGRLYDVSHHSSEAQNAGVTAAFTSLSSGTGRYGWAGLVFGGPLVALWRVCGDEQMVQRTLSARSVPDARTGAILAAALALIMPFAFGAPGIVARLIFQTELNCGRGGCQDENGGFRYLAVRLLPTGLFGTVVGAALCATASSAMGAVHSAASVLSMELLPSCCGCCGTCCASTDRRGVTELSLVRRARVLSFLLVFGALAVYAAMWKDEYGNMYAPAQWVQDVAGAVGVPVVTTVLFGLVWRFGHAAALVGMVGGHTLGAVRLLAVLASGSKYDPKLNFDPGNVDQAASVLDSPYAFGAVQALVTVVLVSCTAAWSARVNDSVAASTMCVGGTCACCRSGADPSTDLDVLYGPVGSEGAGDKGDENGDSDDMEDGGVDVAGSASPGGARRARGDRKARSTADPADAEADASGLRALLDEVPASRASVMTVGASMTVLAVGIVTLGLFW